MTWNVACPKCLEPISPGSRFCSRCGNDVSGPQGSLTTVEVAPKSAIGRDTSAEILESLRRATLGDYDIVGELGRGGMAIVYLAHDIALDRKVAIKVMNPGLLLGPGMTERFKREARTAAALTHPHIIPIHIVRETEKLLYFVMKYVEGRSLDSILAETGALPIKMVLAILAQVGTALEYAHRRGVVHRDVKPANIMIDTDGWVIVTDFGIAKVAEAGSLTISGTAIGTPSYMSPEQCSARPVTGASDQYSLGIVGFEMLSGRPPFVGDSLMDVMRMHFFETPPPVSTVRPDCAPALAAAIDRMLAKDPQQRWPSIEDAITAAGSGTLARDDPVRTHMVELAKTGIKPVARLSTPVSPSPVRSAEPRRASRQGRPLRNALFVGIVGAAAAGGAWLAYRSLGPTQDPVAVVEIAGAPATLDEGQQVRLTASAKDAAGNPVPSAPIRWTSSDTTVAVVSLDGALRAVRVGTTTVEASSGGQVRSVQVTVTAVRTVAAETAPTTPARQVADTLAPAARDSSLRPVRERRVATVSVSPVAPSILVGDSQQLRATAVDSGARPVSVRRFTWASDDSRIASVSASGIVVGVAPGRATITATTDGRRSGAAAVTVAEPEGAVVQVSLTSWANVTVDGNSWGQQNRLEIPVSSRRPHTLRFEREGYVTVDTTVTLQPGKTQLLRISMKERSP